MDVVLNFYEILGLTQNATTEDIRRAYRRLARQHHPDITGHADAIQFREVQLAYETLSNAASRAGYDRTIETRVPVRIVPTTRSPIYAEPLIPPHRSASTFVRRSPFAEQEPFEETLRLMDQLFSRLQRCVSEMLANRAAFLHSPASISASHTWAERVQESAG